MIRPITVICWILALGAGLYLYRAKHEVELMDKHIDQIGRQTSDLRAESRHLLDDWIRLGEPEQLHKYSDVYLRLKTIAPGQFARLGDLANRLPTPRADPPDEQFPDGQSDLAAQSEAVASGVPSPGIPLSGVLSPSGQSAAARSDPGADPDSMNEADNDDLPVPPIPPTVQAITAVSMSGGIAPPLQARPVSPRPTNNVADPEAARPHPALAARTVDDPRAATKPTPAPIADPEAARPHSAIAARTADDPHAAAKPAPGTLADPRPGAPAQSEAMLAPAIWQTRGLPPSQARGPATSQGLPPLQDQGPAAGSSRAPAQYQAVSQSSGLPALRPADPRHDLRVGEPRQETRPAQQWPPREPSLDPRAGDPRTGQVVRQAPPQVPMAAPTQAGGSPQGGSLLGRPRSSMPLPAPMPFNATWAGPGGTGPTGPGR
jgi:hypothetical protein